MDPDACLGEIRRLVGRAELALDKGRNIPDSVIREAIADLPAEEL